MSRETRLLLYTHLRELFEFLQTQIHVFVLDFNTSPPPTPAVQVKFTVLHMYLGFSA